MWEWTLETWSGLWMWIIFLNSDCSISESLTSVVQSEFEELDFGIQVLRSLTFIFRDSVLLGAELPALMRLLLSVLVASPLGLRCQSQELQVWLPPPVTWLWERSPRPEFICSLINTDKWCRSISLRLTFTSRPQIDGSEEWIWASSLIISSFHHLVFKSLMETSNEKLFFLLRLKDEQPSTIMTSRHVKVRKTGECEQTGYDIILNCPEILNQAFLMEPWSIASILAPENKVNTPF